MEIGNRLDKKEDSTKISPFIDFKTISENLDDKFGPGLEELDADTEKSTKEKSTETLAKKESSNSLTDAKELANAVLGDIQKKIDSLKLFNPRLDLAMAISLLSPEMIQNGVSYDPKFWPPELKAISSKMKQPFNPAFFINLLSYGKHLSQSIVDAKQVSLSDRPKLKTPSMLLVPDLEAILETYPNGKEIVDEGKAALESFQNQQKEKREWAEADEFTVVENLLSSASKTTV